MWIQDKVRSKELILNKIGTECNGADLGTKVHDKPRLDYLLGLLGFHFAEGQMDSSAPQDLSGRARALK